MMILRTCVLTCRAKMYSVFTGFVTEPGTMWAVTHVGGSHPCATYGTWELVHTGQSRVHRLTPDDVLSSELTLT